MIQCICIVAVVVLTVCCLLVVYASLVLASRCDQAAERYWQEQERK